MSEVASASRVPKKSLLLDRAIPAILILAAIVISALRLTPDQHDGIGQSLSILCSVFEAALTFGLMTAAVTAHIRAFPGVLGNFGIALPRMGSLAIAAGSVGACIIAMHNYDLTGLAIAIGVMLALHLLLIRILFTIRGRNLLTATAFLAVFEFASLIAVYGVKGMQG